MECRSRGGEKVVGLLGKGVVIPDPGSVDVGDEVDLGRISDSGVTIFPGCRIYGAKTVISAGCVLGAEGPATVDGCRLGPGVELKAGYFRNAVFLEKANMALGAHVREGCLLEEEANGAHCVGLKQTILFPFVTLGSLINFCDCLLAGGRSRKDHSEVGSSYIHFNFTPDQDKTTPSLFGDVPRGVMLDQPPIFLGGQGGAVGPVRVGFGTVVAAGSVLRRDVPEDGKLVVEAPPARTIRDFAPHAYPNLARVVRNNILYLANLTALHAWYREVRRPFFVAQELGELIYEGALEMLSLAVEERTKRLAAMAEKLPVGDDPRSTGLGREFRGRVHEISALFTDTPPPPGDGAQELRAGLLAAAGPGCTDYVSAIQRLDPALKAKGTEWLQGIVDDLSRRAGALLPAVNL